MKKRKVEADFSFVYVVIANWTKSHECYKYLKGEKGMPQLNAKEYGCGAKTKTVIS